MRLQDKIACATEPLRVLRPDSEQPIELPSAALLAADLRATHVRYVLDDAVAVLITHAAFAEPERMARCLDLVRIPAPRLWIEWSELSRLSLMKELGLVEDGEETFRLGSRAGLLVSADPTGRRGTVQIAWDGEDENAPDLSPLTIEFDFDNPALAREVNGIDTLGITIADSDAVSFILSHARFRVSLPWVDYYNQACPAPEAYLEALKSNALLVAGDLALLVSFCLVLSSRGAVEETRAELQRLNAARVKRGKAPLLDHTQVSAHLDGVGAAERDSVAGERSAARLHFVCGHFVRRGERVFWRRAHLRGRAQFGQINRRTISLILDPDG